MQDCLFTLTIDGRSVTYTYDGFRGFLLEGANLALVAPNLVAKKKLNLTGATGRPGKQAETAREPQEITETPVQTTRTRRGEQLSEPSASSRAPNVGRTASVALPGTKQNHPIQYEIREAADLIPSHDAQTFERNPNYALTNDRDYTDPVNRLAVEDASKPGQFNPGLVIATGASALTGPPVITPNGTTLGGNSRVMMMQRMYRNTEDAARYVEYLKEEAAAFGLTPEAVGAFKQPVLVRVISPKVNELQRMVTALNVSETKPLTPAERTIALSRGLQPATLDFIAAQLEAEGEDATLARVLQGSRGIAILNRLIRDEIFTDVDRNRLVDTRTGQLTQAARQEITEIVVGRLYRDKRQIDRTPLAVQAKLVRIAPYVARISGTEWDLAGRISNAIDAVLEAGNARKLAEIAQQPDLMTGEVRYSPDELALANAIIQQGPRNLEKAFREYAADAGSTTGTVSMFAAGATPAESFARLFPLPPAMQTKPAAIAPLTAKTEPEPPAPEVAPVAPKSSKATKAAAKPAPSPAREDQVNEGNLQRIFNLTKAQAKAVLSLWKAMGIPIDRIRLRREGETQTGKGLAQAVTSQMDAEYMAAAEAGDTAKAQEMVNQAAKAAGYTIGPVYHGTKRKFWVFDATKGKLNVVRDEVRTPNFFSFNREFAEDYADYGQPETSKRPTRLISAFVKAETLWDYRRKEDLQKAARGGFDAEKLATGDWKLIEGPSFQRWLKSQGYNGLVNRERFADNIAVFDPTQMKLADPITRDRNGKIIPLSRRFQGTSPDIRYQEAYHAARQNFAPEEGFPNGRLQLDRVGTEAGAGRYGWGIYLSPTREAAEAQAGEGAAPTVYELDIPNGVIGRLNDYGKPLSGGQRSAVLKEAKKAGLNMDDLAQAGAWEPDASLADIMTALEDAFEELDLRTEGAGNLASWQKSTAELLNRAGVQGVIAGQKGKPIYVLWNQAALDQVALMTTNQGEMKAIQEEVQALPLPSDAPTTVNGFIEFLNAEQQELADGALAVIQGFAGANVSTPIHEGFHFYRRFLLNEANGFTQKELDAFAKWAGAQDGIWTVAAEEKAARGFERYMREGKLPARAPQGLAGLFEKIAAWMKEVYKAIKGSEIDITISPAARTAFDKIFTLQGERGRKAPTLIDNGVVVEALGQVSLQNEKAFSRFRQAADGLQVFLRRIGDRAVNSLASGLKAQLEQRLEAVEKAAGLPSRLYQAGKDLEERTETAQTIAEEATSPEAAKEARAKRVREIAAARKAFLAGDITEREMQAKTATRMTAVTPEKARQQRQAVTKEAFGGRSIAEFAKDTLKEIEEGGPQVRRTPSQAKQAERQIRMLIRTAAQALTDGRINQGQFDLAVRKSEEAFTAFKDKGANSPEYDALQKQLRVIAGAFAPPSASLNTRPGFDGKTITEVLNELLEGARLRKAVGLGGRAARKAQKAAQTEEETAEIAIMRGLKKAVYATPQAGQSLEDIIDEVMDLGRAWLDAIATQDFEAIGLAQLDFNDAVRAIPTGVPNKQARQKTRESISRIRQKVGIRLAREAKAQGKPTAPADLTADEQARTDRQIKRWVERFERAMRSSDPAVRLGERMDDLLRGLENIDRREAFDDAISDYRDARDNGDNKARVIAERRVREALSSPQRRVPPPSAQTVIKGVISGQNWGRGQYSFRSPLSVLNIKGTYERVAGNKGRLVSDIFHLVHTRFADNEYAGFPEAMQDLRQRLGVQTNKPGYAEGSLLQAIWDEGLHGLAEQIVNHIDRLETRYKRTVATARTFIVRRADGSVYIPTGAQEPKLFFSKTAAQAAINGIPSLKDAKIEPSITRADRMLEMWHYDPVMVFTTLTKSYVYNTSLRYAPKAVTMNYVSLLVTVWPHLTPKEFVQVLKKAMNPKPEDLAFALRSAGGFYETPGSDLALEAETTSWWKNPFAKSNDFARMVGYYTGELLADRMPPGKQLTKEGRRQYMRDWTDRTEVDNSQWNVPPLFSGDIGSTFGQFRPFQIKNLERVVADFREGIPGSQVSDRARRAKLLAAIMLTGGVNATLSLVPGLRPLGAATAFAGAGMLGFGLAKAFAGVGLLKVFGIIALAMGHEMGDEEWADEFAEALMYGLPSFANIDLSSSMLFTDELYGNSPEEQMIALMLGPGISKYVKTGKALTQLIKEMQKPRNLGLPEDDFYDRVGKAGWKVAQEITPLTRQGRALWEKATQGEATMKLDQAEVPMTGAETVARIAGFTPLRQSIYYERKRWRDVLPGMPIRTGETDEQYAERKREVLAAEEEYGAALRAAPLFNRMSPEQKKEAGDILRRRIVEQHKRLPQYRKPSSLRPNAIIRAVVLGEEREEREQQKMIVPKPARPTP